jgi:hypothetical protein
MGKLIGMGGRGWHLRVTRVLVRPKRACGEEGDEEAAGDTSNLKIKQRFHSNLGLLFSL